MFEFDEACSSTFEEIKAKLVIYPNMATPEWSKEFKIMGDASDYAIRAVLRQRKYKIFRAIYYVNKAFDEGQENYSTTEKEMLTMAFSCEKFRPNIMGSHVIIHTVTPPIPV